MRQKSATRDPMSLIILRASFTYLSPLLPGIMSRFAYKLWCTPPRMKPPEREHRYIKSAKTTFINVEGQNIKTWSWGQGPTVLFVHGWGGRGTQVSCFIDELNKAGFSVMSIDMPAHGESDGKQTNPFEMAKALDEVIKHIGPLHSVITHSFGGIIFGFYYKIDLKLNNVVMICPPSTLNTAFNQIATMLHWPSAVKNYIIDTVKKKYGSNVLEKVSLLNNATKITQPVLVIHDVQDDVVPLQDGKDVAAVLPHATFYETNEFGHRKILYANQIVKRTVDFVATQRS